MSYILKLFKKKFERKKMFRTVYFGPWLPTDQCKQVTKNCNSIGTGAHSVGRNGFWPNFDLYFPDIRRV